jgi:hypothetical protein
MERILFIEFFKLLHKREKAKGKMKPALSKNLEMRIFRGIFSQGGEERESANEGYGFIIRALWISFFRKLKMQKQIIRMRAVIINSNLSGILFISLPFIQNSQHFINTIIIHKNCRKAKGVISLLGKRNRKATAFNLFLFIFLR